MRQPASTATQIVLSLALLGAAAVAWTHRDAGLSLLGASVAAPVPARQADGPAPVPVIAAEVGEARDAIRYRGVGTGRAERSVTLRIESAGTVAEMALEPGRRYEAGDELLRLESRAERLALSLAETRLAEAERVRTRYSRLQDRGAAALARLDEVETAAEIARLEVERAREALADRVLRAPFAGVAGLPAVEPGSWVDSDTDIASFDDRSRLLVEFDMPEALLARIGTGMAATAETPAFPREVFAAEVSAIDSRIDPASRTARVRVAVPNPDDRLRPGASFAIALDIGGEPHPTVPELALQFAEGSLAVWRVTGDTVERVPVRMVRRQAGLVLVDGALSPGDRVVVEGTQRLSPGRAVSVGLRDEGA